MKITLPLKSLSLALLLCGAFAAHAETSASTTQALEAARASVKTATDLKWVWRDTEDMLTEAEAAAAAGDDAKAAKLAKKAKAEADAAVNQYYLEKAKPMLAGLQAKHGLSAFQKGMIQDAATAVANAEGKKAYDIVSPP
ncbi:MAG: hypothetical protein HY941_04960 [Gammaproteobacteria bacterium]|nr:hypothetical protein [Gammaproteobacteria bacterium]